MSEVKCFLDQNGAKRVLIEPPEWLVGCFLEQDVQGSVKSCEFLFDIVDKILTGKELSWEGTGNAHTITITKETVHIYNEFSDDEVTCTLEFFITALKLWREFISQH